MWRIPTGAWFDTRDGSPWKAGDVLELLAPAAAAPNKHHISAISLRQHYIRGTRFLTSEALAALVDNSADSLGRRKDVFADLLGIRHLRDAEQACARFITELAPAIREQEAVARRIRHEIAELEPLVKDTANAEGLAAENLAAAEALLRLEAKSSTDERLQAVAAAIGSARHNLSVREGNLERLASFWPRKSELDRKIEYLQTSEREAAQASQLATEDREKADAHLAERVAAEDNAEAALGRLAAVADNLETLLGAALTAAALADPYLPPDTVTLGALVAAAPEFQWDAGARAARQAQINAAIAAEPRVDRVLASRAAVVGRQEALEGRQKSSEELERLRSTLSERQQLAAQALSDADALAGPLAALQTAGVSVVEHRHSAEADCPLCGHDWVEHDALKAAVEATLSAAPQLVAAARSVASAAASEADRARSELDSAVQFAKDAADLQRELQALDDQFAEERELLEAVGAPISGDERRAALEWAQRRLELGKALAELSAAQVNTLPIVTTDGVRYLTAALRTDQLKPALDQAIGLRKATLDAEFAGAHNAAETARAAQSASVAQDRVRRDALAAIRVDLASAKKERTDILALWSSVAPNTTWSTEAMDRLQQDLQASVTIVDQAEARLAAASAAWDIEGTHVNLARLKADLAPIERKVARMKARSATALAMEAEFRHSYIATSQTQVGGLSRVVNALFLRMHANRIVDRIDLGQSESFLQWLADAGTAQLDPGRDFSQGQRQDLALALFLARARGLGGTFFLDEPVAHLDDLNRVGLLDVFRAVALEGGGNVRLVITTASRSLARHMIEKFGAIAAPREAHPTLRVIELRGNGRLGVTQTQVFPVPS